MVSNTVTCWSCGNQYNPIGYCTSCESIRLQREQLAALRGEQPVYRRPTPGQAIFELILIFGFFAAISWLFSTWWPIGLFALGALLAQLAS